ncbi:probable multidrug resistance-associated protein lethal(2)03659 isoform X2 [Phymastichus coffea]|nr:probable multidrug resistance-associated protein lethal(2)03659 isoform X2 [Phymastichus coffea]XP_058798978.1 probable multidrug resistance-associated protein lethal(2)03659 isoform X2 [Phymastichus coffea]
MEREEAFYWGTGIILGVLLDCIIGHPASQGLMHMGMKIRVATCSLIYRKTLRVSKSAFEGETSIGQMVNLLSNDVNRLDYSVFSIHYIWIAPIQTALVSYLLYQEVSLSAVGGILFLLIFIPIHGCYGKLVSYLTLKFAYKTDERLRLTNEIISGVKVIKMYAWEKPFSYLIDKAREKEVKIIRNNLMATEINWSFESYVPRVCLFITILVYVLLGNDINAEKVYLVTAYYNVLRTTLYRSFALSIKEIAEALVSVRRLQKFLLFEEIDYKSLANGTVNFNIKNDVALSFKNITAKWNPESKFEALKNITLNVRSKTLTAVVGQVGSGKTTLLHAILKEIPITQGDLKVNGKISYASQESWLFASSIKQNILFGKTMDNERYEKVVEVCQLKRDFQLLPYGDNTLVGEKGINLSGGQCARVNLARAVYYDADIYLLDDPLSAVDIHVGKGIFDECIKTFLKNKTVILVTHQLHFLKNVDRIIILSGGAVQAEGAYSQLINSGLDLAKMMKLENESEEINNDNENPIKEGTTIVEAETVNHEEDEQIESRTLGNISAKTYLQYFRAARSGFLVFIVFFISLMCQATSSGADYFITYWVNIEEHGKNFTYNEDDILRGRSWYMYTYGTITIATMFVTLAQAYTFFNMCMKISRNLHAMMFNSIIRTTMAFFNANPIGRIMNRFSKDMGIVDTRVPQTVIDVMQISMFTFAVIGIVASVNLYFIVAAVIVGIIAYFLRIFYIRTSRSIKRLEGITRSPVFNHLSASVHGITTIRALKAQDILTKEFDEHQDLHSSAWFIFFSGSRAFGMYVEVLCAIFTGVVVYALLSIKNVAMAGDAGLVITQCILLAGMLQWGVRQTAELENHMTSVERILEYSKLPAEPKLERTLEHKIADNWPTNGKVIFKNVTLIYDRQEKPALKNLDFTVKPKEMIGIVGRTGAGKSSLINALFRLTDIEGEIYIDDVPTSEIALQHLRSKISIIPQEPVLFAGTLRRNLDPFEEYTDNDLWCALQDVELKELLNSDLGLNMRVMEGGSNFSVGQRQLLCLARAIVRNNKILVLDEATANVDPSTDELIQKAVRRKFETCTVLIIAHRLNTVMDSNKILVMDAGQAVEFDHPYVLLQKEDGIFHSMVQQTGSCMAANLLEIAKKSYEANQGSDNTEN